MTIDPLSTDRLNSLPQVPAPMIYDGARVEVSRQGEWIPGVVVGADDHDRERGFAIDVDLDRPDASGATQVFVTSYDKIRPAASAAIVQAAE